MMLPLTMPDGPLMVPTRQAGPHGLWCREGTADESIAKSAPREYSSLLLRDRVVLDVGANIGSFTRHAALSGAKLVVAIEPEESNFTCLQKNAGDLENVLLLRGCLGVLGGETEIFIAPSGKNPGNTTQTPRRGRHAQRVMCWSISDIMSKYKPESVKLDCEGAEYTIGWPHMMSSTVDIVAAEIHIQGFGIEMATEFAKSYTDAGWIGLQAPSLRASNWHTLGAWQRG